MPHSNVTTQATGCRNQHDCRRDGLETCSLDPCAAVRTAKAAGVPFVLHVVGFDIADKNTAELECAAQHGGGLYLAADSAPQLSEALLTAYEKPTIPDGRLVVTTTADGELQDTIITVTDALSGEQVGGGRTYVSSETNPRRIPIEDGKYRAEVKAVRIMGSPGFAFDFEIVDGSQVEKTFDYSAGEVAIKVTRNGELTDATVNVHVESGAHVTGARTYDAPRDNPTKLTVAAGTYTLKIKPVKMLNGSEHVIESVVVKGGESTELSYDYASGLLSVGVRRGDALVDAAVHVIDESGKNIGGGRTYASPGSNPKQFIVTPGAYTVRITEIRGDKREVTATVIAMENTEVLIDLDQP